MTKLKPGVRLFRSSSCCFLISPSITHNCVGNDSSYSFCVFCFGQLSRLFLLN